MTTDFTAQKDGFVLRAAAAADAAAYYEQNYCPLDPEVARLTGCKPAFTRQEVTDFLLRSLTAEDRYLFLLVSPEGRILGESVLNEIDWQLRCANFRICLYHAPQRGRGLGSWMTAVTRDFAFGTLGLHRLELDVYSFNPRAEKAYRKAGFQREGVLRDAVLDGDKYAADILMAMLETDWQQLDRRYL